MKKITLALAHAGLLSLAAGTAHAGEIDDLKETVNKLQQRLAQLEQKEAARPAATPSSLPVLAGTAIGGNPNLTLYGKLDLFTEYNANGGKGDRLALDSGGLNGSRLGVKGGADVADGLRGIFQLESGFFANKGSLAQGGRFFGRQAYAGLESAKYGRLTAGRQYSPLYNTVISFDAFEQGYGSPTTDGNVSTGATRFDSSLVYATPKFAGFSANVMVAMGGETGRSSDAKALAVNYENGPFGLGAAYQNDDHNSSASNVIKNAFVGASYQIKATKLLAGFGRAVREPDAGAAITRHEWMIGSRSAVTQTGQLLLSYGEGRNRDAQPSDKGSVATLGWVESIGGQSKVYGIVSHHKNSAGSALVPMGTSSAANYTINPGDSALGLALGYQYNF